MIIRSTNKISTIMTERMIKKSAIKLIRIFSFLGIPLFSSNGTMYFLYVLVFLNHVSALFELLAKQKTANRKNGPPGSTGSTVPKIPIAKEIRPTSINRIFINLRIEIIFVLSLNPPVNHFQLINSLSNLIVKETYC